MVVSENSLPHKGRLVNRRDVASPPGSPPVLSTVAPTRYRCGADVEKLENH
ncbi:MAG: hypothetical protein FWE59_00180 [Oscillospiraceae bacterium]|nr:hypothetical protein [Oscillospiraceae bacterium]